MQVEPAKLVELAAASEGTLAAMAQDWASALEDLSGACRALGDAKGTMNVSASYADSLADAAAVVGALVEALDLGVSGLVEAAHDAVRTDDTVAAELERAAHGISHDDFGHLPGHGGR